MHALCAHLVAAAVEDIVAVFGVEREAHRVRRLVQHVDVAALAVVTMLMDGCAWKAKYKRVG